MRVANLLRKLGIPVDGVDAEVLELLIFAEQDGEVGQVIEADVRLVGPDAAQAPWLRAD